MTQDIQEMLEGLLNDEQTAELLHRLSVSPEKLTAFRQHMALQGAFDRDGRASEMTEDEDNAVWAALLGATGGVVTGGASAGASGWLAKAAAFVATGIAGFFIGTVVDQSGNDAATPNAPVAEQAAPAPQSPTVITRVDTVIRTVIQPRIEYRDRIMYKPAPTSPEASIAQTQESRTDASVDTEASSLVGKSGTHSPSPTGIGISAAARKSLADLATAQFNAAIAESSERNTQNAVAPVENQAGAVYKDPNAVLNSSSDATIAKSDLDTENPRNKPSPTVSLVRNGWEIAYNERLGRVAPAPEGLVDADPDFGGRAIDLSYRLLEGRIGFGVRLMYGSFSRVTLQEEKWFDLGVEETKFNPSLGTERGFGTELFLNYRIPLFSDRLALGAEIVGGALVTQSKVGGDLSLLYLITDRIGAQVGAGYSMYWYNTRELREEALRRFENTGTTSGLNEVYQGTMLEGRYGLFYRF